MSVDDLWSLHERISGILSSRIKAEKRDLEKRLAILSRKRRNVSKPESLGHRPIRPCHRPIWPSVRIVVARQMSRAGIDSLWWVIRADRTLQAIAKATVNDRFGDVARWQIASQINLILLLSRTRHVSRPVA
jgi:hypothetical protein